jgi:hypothetical protein
VGLSSRFTHGVRRFGVVVMNITVRGFCVAVERTYGDHLLGGGDRQPKRSCGWPGGMQSVNCREVRSYFHSRAISSDKGPFVNLV